MVLDAQIDVEGFELQVLEGVAAADWHKIDQVAIELHDVAGRASAAEHLLRSRGGFANVKVVRDRKLHDAGFDNVMLYATRVTV